MEGPPRQDRLGMRAHQHVDLPSTVEFLRTLGFLIDV
jgi:hypothetical protein